MANPPPPYTDITGISRTVMKDNAQETIVNYNGNARPGEIVADLTQDPPVLYIGNNLGQLTALSTGGGGNASLPLANGTSNFNIATVNGNVTVNVAGLETWTFDTNGNLTIPGDILGTSTIRIDNRGTGNTADISVFSADDITLQARDRTLGNDIEGGDINIFAGDGSPDDAGGGTGSGGDVQIIGGVGGLADISSGGQGGFVRLDAGRGGDGSATANAGSGGDTYVSAGQGGVAGGLGGGGGGDVYITAGDTTDATQDRGSIFLNGGGGGDDTTVGGYVRISIPAAGTSPGGNWTFTGSGRTLEPPPDAEIFNPSVGNLTVGTVGNTIVRSVDGFTTYDWVFGNTGNLTLPNSGSIIGNTANNSGSLQWIGNSSGDGGGYTTLQLRPDDTRVGSDQYLIVDPTAPGHIHIRAGGAQDNSSADLFLGGENSYVKVGAGIDPPINIVSSGNVWTYNSDGTLSAPGAIVSTPANFSNLVAVAGARAFISDGNLVAAGNFGANVSGGGSNTVPVWSDGANWYIG